MRHFCHSLLLLFMVAYSALAQNYSLSFDGNSYVSVPHSDSLNLSNQLTIECWFTVQGASINDWIGVVCKLEASAANYSGYFFGLNQAGPYPNTIRFRILPSNADVNCPFSPILNHWYNMTVTYNGSAMKLFLDGNLIQQTSATSLIASNTFPLTIGGQSGNFFSRNLNGKIDEVRISSIARYDSNFVPRTHFDDDMYTRALYHFNEGTGNTVFDSSGNNNNGTIYGAIWSSDVPVTVPEEAMNEPDKFALEQNYPNPFNPSTTIKYDLPVDTRVTLKVFNILGQEVITLVSEEQKAGYKSVEWNATNVASGVYFYRIQAGDFIASKKLLLLK